MDRVNEFFDESREDGKRKFYIVLKPDGPARTLDSTQLNRQLVALEKKWWQDFKGEKQRECLTGATWNEENDGCIGLEAANKAVDDIWMDAFLAGVGDLTKTIKQTIFTSSQTVKQLRERIRALAELPDMADNFVTDFNSHLIAILNQTHVEDIPMTNRLFSAQKVYDAKECGYTWDEEFAQTAANDADEREALPPSCELEEVLGKDSYLKQRLQMKFVGKAAIDRAIEVFGVLCLKKAFRPVDQETLENIARTKTDTGDVHTARVLHEVVTCQIARSVSPLIGGLLDRLMMILTYSMQPVLEYMTQPASKYNLFGEQSRLPKEITEHSRSLLNQQLEEVIRQTQYTIKRSTRRPVLDGMSKTLMLSSLFPVSSVVPEEQTLLPTEGTRRTVLVNAQEGSGGLPSSPSTTSVASDPASQMDGSAKLRLIRQTLEQVQVQGPTTFKYEDLVCGGVIHPSHLHLATMNVKYMNDTAFYCFLHIILDLIGELRATIETELMAFIVDGRDAQFVKLLRKSLDLSSEHLSNGFSEDEGQLQKELDKEEKSLQRLEAIKIDLANLIKNRGKLGGC